MENNTRQFAAIASAEVVDIRAGTPPEWGAVEARPANDSNANKREIRISIGAPCYDITDRVYFARREMS